MTKPGSSDPRRKPKGVTILAHERAGRRFRAWIGRGKGVKVHLGLYRTAGEAALAYNQAAGLIRGAGAPVNEISRAEQPAAEDVRRITATVRRRLGLDPPPGLPEDRPPDGDRLVALFEVAIVEFWRTEVSGAGMGLDAAAARLVEGAEALFWCHSAGHPTPLEILAALVSRRLDQAFRRSDLTREVLEDDGDDPFFLARWLVFPEVHPGARGFRDEVRHLYGESFRGEPGRTSAGSAPSWAEVLGIAPPFDSEQVRAAYRAGSRSAHPDAGGSPAEFVRLQAAYEEAQGYCAALGL